MPTHLSKTSLATELAGVLSSRIANGLWPIGHKLPSEQKLVDEFGIGRSTVREAVRGLAVRGLVEARQGSGVYVIAQRAPNEFDRAISRAALADVYEVRIALEVEAARLAALRRTTGQLAEVSAALELRDRLSRTRGGDFVDADIAFHTVIVAASGNPVLIELFDRFTPVLGAALRDLEQFEIAEDAGEQLHNTEHAELAVAVESQDPEAAQKITRAMHEQTLQRLR